MVIGRWLAEIIHLFVAVVKRCEGVEIANIVAFHHVALLKLCLRRNWVPLVHLLVSIRSTGIENSQRIDDELNSGILTILEDST